MSGSLSTAANAEPNLTPILDMVFQLITFFMLVINFKSASMDLSLRLPVVGSARPVETKGAKELLLLNVNEKGQIVIYNTPTDNIEGYLFTEAQSSLQLAKKEKKNADLQLGDELPTIVVIRADRRTPFHDLNRVITACQNNGFRNFYYKAMTKEAGT